MEDISGNEEILEVQELKEKKTKKRRSISSKIIGVNAVIIILSMIGMVAFTYNMVTKNLTRQAAQEIKELTNSFMLSYKSMSTTYNAPVNRLTAEIQDMVESGDYTREELYDYLEQVVLTEDNLSALTVMFEENAFDGKDRQYKGTGYGTAESGKLSYYIYEENGNVKFLNGIEDNEDEYNYAYYTKPLDSHEMYVTTPYKFADSGKIAITITKPIMIDGEAVGVIGSDVMLSDLAASFGTISFHDTGSVGLCLSDGTTIDGNAYPLQPELFADPSLVLPTDDQTKITRVKNSSGISYVVSAALYRLNDEGGFYVVTTVKESDITSTIRSFVLMLIIAFTIVTAIILFSLYNVVNKLMKPLKKLTLNAREVAKGNLDVDFTVVANDEIGELTESFSEMASSITLILHEVDEMSKATVRGDSSVKMSPEKYQGEFATMAQNINDLAEIFEGVLYLVLDYSEGFAHGDFDMKIKDLPGEQMQITNVFNKLQEQLNHVENEIGKFIKAGVNGHLSYSLDTNGFDGGWKDILDQLNELFASIAVPVSEVSKFIKNISDTGNYQVTLDTELKGDFEITRKALNNMLVELFANIEEVSSVLDKLSHNNYNVTIERKYIGDFSIIKDSLVNIIGQLNKVMSEISSSTGVITTSVHASAEISINLADASMRQNEAITVLLQDIETVIGETNKNAENAKQANAFSLKTLDNAKTGNTEMQQMVDTINEISVASQSIGNIISIIEDIAFQTNLLALNAAVEAARAGVHGKGFAVVAEEVRSLAARSHEAALDTKTLIEQSMKRVKEGTEKADSTSQSLHAIFNDISQVSEIINKIAEGSTIQATHIADFGHKVNEISDVVNLNTATSEESAAIAQEISAQTESLKSIISSFEFTEVEVDEKFF